jgi:hypothetical protein
VQDHQLPIRSHVGPDCRSGRDAWAGGTAPPALGLGLLLLDQRTSVVRLVVSVQTSDVRDLIDAVDLV